MADYTIILADSSGVYSVSKVYRGGTTTNSGGTEITSTVQNVQAANPFLPGLQALLAIKNDKAAGN